MITVYGMPMSRATRATWTLEEAGASYEFRLVDLMKGEGRSEEFLAINPAGKVPVLVDGGILVTESLAICAYLAETFPEARLSPDLGTPERAAWLRYSAFAVCELEQPLWTMAKHQFALPQRYRVPGIMDTARWEFRQAAAIVAARLDECPHMAGERFTTADVLVGHTLRWARKALGDLEDPRLDAYVDRVTARPALARAGEREQAAAEG